MNLLGFDIGGTKCAVIYGVGDENDVKIVKKSAIPTDHTKKPEEMMDLLVELAKRENFPAPDRIGVSCGGPLSSEKGIIINPANLPQWINFDIVSYLTNIYHVNVNLQNDANACALAEWRLGAGKGSKNMVFLTFGTGFGAGLILNGKLYVGTNDNAGECGHLRISPDGPIGFGKPGSLEGYCSGGGIAKLAVMYGFKGTPTAKDVAIAARNGDETALKIYEKSGEMLGLGLSVLIDILNPEVIVIGSIFERSGDLLIPSMEKAIKEEALGLAADVCKVVPAKLGDSIGDYAALITATM